MNRLIKAHRLLAAGVLLSFLCGCQSQPSSSGMPQSPSSGSASSAESDTGSSQSNDSASTSPPTGGVSLPSSNGQAGSQSTQGDKGENEGSESGGGSDGGSEEETLSEALEAFERARGGKAGAEEEFPILLPETRGVQGEDLEASASSDIGEASSEQAAGSSTTDGAWTTNEKVSVLDRRLEESYGSFDGMILRERGHVRGKENERGSDIDEADPDGTEGVNASAEGGDGGPASEPVSGSGTGRRPENPEQREGEFEHAGVANAPPADIPDGSDDDVVARQLREAATREPDPELREKLWEEYRKYKNKPKG